MVWLRVLSVALIAGTAVACTKLATSQQAQRPLTDLAGSEWGLEGQNAPFVRFGSNGDMNGNGGCNNFGGRYELNGQRLIIGPIMSTKKACLGPTMDQETQFFKALQEAHHIEATHLNLKIFDADNNEILSLIRRDWD